MVGMKLDEVCMFFIVDNWFLLRGFHLHLRVTTEVNTEVKTGYHQKGFTVQKVKISHLRCLDLQQK